MKRPDPRDPFKNWTVEMFLEQERRCLERARKHDRYSALYFTQAAAWRQRAEAIDGAAYQEHQKRFRRYTCEERGGCFGGDCCLA